MTSFQVPYTANGVTRNRAVWNDGTGDIPLQNDEGLVESLDGVRAEITRSRYVDLAFSTSITNSGSTFTSTITCFQDLIGFKNMGIRVRNANALNALTSFAFDISIDNSPIYFTPLNTATNYTTDSQDQNNNPASWIIKCAGPTPFTLAASAATFLKINTIGYRKFRFRATAENAINVIVEGFAER